MLPDRFWAKVDKTEACWNWTACLDPQGYGRYNHNRKTKLSHRLAYEEIVGPIPDGLHLDHLCKNRRCLNPEHLEPVTPQENLRRSSVLEAKAAITHCPHGHEYTAENTHINTNGARSCRACRRGHVRRWHQARPDYQAAWARAKTQKRKHATTAVDACV